MEEFAQSVETLLSNPKVLHVTAAGVLGLGVGWLLRLIFRLVMLYLASVTVLLVILQWSGVIRVEIDFSALNNILVNLANLLKKLPWSDPLFFTGGVLSGYKFGLFRR